MCESHSALWLRRALILASLSCGLASCDIVSENSLFAAAKSTCRNNPTHCSVHDAGAVPPKP